MPLPAGPGGMSRLGADGLLLTTALLWGVTFVAQKYAAATMPALAFVAARFAVSAVALAPFAQWEFRPKPHAPGRDEWRLSLESVFAALAGAVMLGERLTGVGALGCLLILAGAVLVEIGPWVGRRTARA
jgi:drug/metabolite transporter (DMT)-like permease